MIPALVVWFSPTFMRLFVLNDLPIFYRFRPFYVLVNINLLFCEECEQRTVL